MAEQPLILVLLYQQARNNKSSFSSAMITNPADGEHMLYSVAC